MRSRIGVPGLQWKMQSHRGILSLSFIVLIAAFLQIEHITQPLTDVFNWREASTAMMAQNFFAEIGTLCTRR